MDQELLPKETARASVVYSRGVLRTPGIRTLH